MNETGKEQFTFNYVDLNPNSGGRMGERKTDNLVWPKTKIAQSKNNIWTSLIFKVLSNLLANITNKRDWKERLSWKGENNNNWQVIDDEDEDNLMASPISKVFFMQEGEKILVHPLTESFIELKWR